MELTVESIITEIEERINQQMKDAVKDGNVPADLKWKFDWNKPADRFRLRSKIDRELEKLYEIEKILNRK
tara:strand:- start:108 stop:317 length:210 start_codon:yes stop_codon:yes gene_type:complete